MASTNLSSSAKTLRYTSGHVSIEWEIKKFLDLLCELDSFLRSGSFPLSDGEWYIEIWSDGEKEHGSDGWISLYLYKRKSSSELKVLYCLGIKKADGSTLKSFEVTHLFPKGCDGRGKTEFFSRMELLKSTDILTADGSLVVFCNIRLLDDVSTAVEAASQTSSIYGVGALSENMSDLFISGYKGDVTFNIKDKNITAHESILVARSSVFRSMFELDMLEKNSREVNITDCEPDCFKDFLFFLYSGKPDIVTVSNAGGLYLMADKYNIQDLKAVCLDCMSREISVESFCDVIQLSAAHNETDLLNTATDFFINKVDTVLSTPKWLTFMVQHAELANELFIKFAKHETSK